MYLTIRGLHHGAYNDIFRAVAYSMVYRSWYVPWRVISDGVPNDHGCPMGSYDVCHGATMDITPGGIPHGRFRFTECAKIHVPWRQPWHMPWPFPWKHGKKIRWTHRRNVDASIVGHPGINHGVSMVRQWRDNESRKCHVQWYTSWTHALYNTMVHSTEQVFPWVAPCNIPRLTMGASMVCAMVCPTM